MDAWEIVGNRGLGEHSRQTSDRVISSLAPLRGEAAALRQPVTGTGQRETFAWRNGAYGRSGRGLPDLFDDLMMLPDQRN